MKYTYDNTIKLSDDINVQELKFEYYTMTLEIPKPIDYDAYRKFQPWPFNSPWSIDETIS